MDARPTAVCLSLPIHPDVLLFIFYRLLEVDYHGRRQELRLHYLHFNKSHTETFPAAALADKQWHQLAIALTTNFVQVFIDCELLFERQMPSVDLISMSSSKQQEGILRKMKLWLAQRDDRGSAQLQVRAPPRCLFLPPSHSSCTKLIRNEL